MVLSWYQSRQWIAHSSETCLEGNYFGRMEACTLVALEQNTALEKEKVKSFFLCSTRASREWSRSDSVQTKHNDVSWNMRMQSVFWVTAGECTKWSCDRLEVVRGPCTVWCNIENCTHFWLIRRSGCVFWGWFSAGKRETQIFVFVQLVVLCPLEKWTDFRFNWRCRRVQFGWFRTKSGLVLI